MAGPLTLVDLFAGAGGLTLGFQSSGFFTSRAAVEVDPAAAATYAANFGADHLFAGDISKWLINHEVPQVDVVVGGPPCQGFSNLGTKDVRDRRNALWRRYVDVLVRSKPSFFVLENVGRFLSSGQYRSLIAETRPRGRLADFAIESHLLNAAEYGVPQLRKRAVLIGRRRDFSPVGPPPPSRSQGMYETVRSAFAGLSPVVTAVELPERTWDVITVQSPGGPRRRTIPGAFETSELHLGRRVTDLSLQRYRAIPPGGNRKDLPTELLAPCWVDHKGSGDVMGRLRWDTPSVTIRTEFQKPEKGRYLHPEEHRPITVLEGARLQTFPDSYRWCGSRSEIIRQIGNAVPPLLAGAVAQHIAAALGRASRDPDAA